MISNGLSDPINEFHNYEENGKISIKAPNNINNDPYDLDIDIEKSNNGAIIEMTGSNISFCNSCSCSCQSFNCGPATCIC